MGVLDFLAAVGREPDADLERRVSIRDGSLQDFLVYTQPGGGRFCDRLGGHVACAFIEKTDPGAGADDFVCAAPGLNFFLRNESVRRPLSHSLGRDEIAAGLSLGAQPAISGGQARFGPRSYARGPAGSGKMRMGCMMRDA